MPSGGVLWVSVRISVNWSKSCLFETSPKQLLGGSVRIPVVFCGIHLVSSLKPTQNRFSYRDVANTVFTMLSPLCLNDAEISQNPGQNTCTSSVGFLSNSIDALRLMMSSVLSTQPWLRDPEVITIPWRESEVESTLSRASIDDSRNHNLQLKLGIY